MIKTLYELYSKNSSVWIKAMDLILLFITTWSFSTGDWMVGMLFLAVLAAHVNLTTVRGALIEALALLETSKQQLDACRQTNIQLAARHQDTLTKVNHILSEIEPEERARDLS